MAAEAAPFFRWAGALGNHNAQGEYYLNMAATGKRLSRYHLEAAIAYWHTQQADSQQKWDSILQLYNTLLMLEYSPIAALNRTYALSKAAGKADAIIEAEKLNLGDNYLYHCLLGYLYTNIDDHLALNHFEKAMKLAKAKTDKAQIKQYIKQLTERMPQTN